MIPTAMARTPRTIMDVLSDFNMTAFLSLASLLWAPAVLAWAPASACTAALAGEEAKTGMRQPAPLPTFGSPEELGDDVRVQLLLGHRYLLPPIRSAGLGTGDAAPKTLWIGRSAWHP